MLRDELRASHGSAIRPRAELLLWKTSTDESAVRSAAVPGHAARPATQKRRGPVRVGEPLHRPGAEAAPAAPGRSGAVIGRSLTTPRGPKPAAHATPVISHVPGMRVRDLRRARAGRGGGVGQGARAAGARGPPQRLQRTCGYWRTERRFRTSWALGTARGRRGDPGSSGRRGRGAAAARGRPRGRPAGRRSGGASGARPATRTCAESPARGRSFVARPAEREGPRAGPPPAAPGRRPGGSN
jgi:hypothetical protein